MAIPEGVYTDVVFICTQTREERYAELPCFNLHLKVLKYN